MEYILTGKASIDKPWLKFYPESVRNMKQPTKNVEAFLKEKNDDENKYIFEYYGNKYTYKWFWQKVDLTARALKTVGFEEGDRIPVFLQAVPAHYILLFAAERIGAAILCRDDTAEELCFAIRKTTTDVIFVHDYISAEDEELILSTTQAKRIIKVSPYDYACKEKMPDYIKNNIAKLYEAKTENSSEDMTWNDFLNCGRTYINDYMVVPNPDRPVFEAYTSGSTGVSKLVIHSSANIVSVAYQMSTFVPPNPIQERWWLPILPPALIAATVSLTIFPLSVGLYVVLDPYCPVDDIDVQFMNLKPNYWALIPMFCELLMNSKRIPDDYDMSHLRTIGIGAEPMNEKRLQEVEKFFHQHNCMAPLTVGYGQSECCSNLTLPNPAFPLIDGCSGMPMPTTTIAIFNPETLEELNYNEIGEVCVDCPAKMLQYCGFSSEKLTEETLVLHKDGKHWLHTGDKGYMSKDGIVYILGRGNTVRYGGGELYMMRMESKIVRVSGVKDGFFCFIPDQEHEGCYIPHLFVILEKNKTIDDVKESIFATLEPHEYPASIRKIDKRPYFHFKTNRKMLTAALLSETKQVGFCL